MQAAPRGATESQFALGAIAMRPSLRLALPLVLAAILFASPSSTAQQSDSSTFELHGTVINAVTGQPVSGALVQLAGNNFAFSGADGTFAFSDLARGQYAVFARKPGFFNEMELGDPNSESDMLKTVPSASDVVVKLSPEGIIYGEIKNEAGDPVEGISVKAQRWEVQGGRRQLQSTGEATTDDEGSFRLADLRPGSYYLVFQQTNQARIRLSATRLQTGKQRGEGVGLQYYPGVADAASATPISIHAGSQIHIGQVLAPLHVFEISGVVPGVSSEGGVMLGLVNSADNNVGNGIRIDRTTGEFHIHDVPAGNYLLVANVWRNLDPSQGLSKPLRSWLPISVNSNISGLVLPLGDAASIPLQVRDETSDGNSNGVHQVSVDLVAKDFPQLSRGGQAPHVENDQASPAVIEDIAPGVYSVEATAEFPSYVADLRCGSVDLLRDDLTISPGTSLPPIEVTVRDDGAELDGTVSENGQRVSAGVVVYSEEYPKRTIEMPAQEGSFSIKNVPPGTYQVFALKNADRLEFTNPAIVQQFLAHATSVTLGRRDKSTVQLEIVPSADQP